MYDLTKSWYETIIGRDILTTMWIELKYFTNTVVCEPGMHAGGTTPMIDLNYYAFEPINGEILPYLEESFINFYLNECFESVIVRGMSKRVRENVDI